MMNGYEVNNWKMKDAGYASTSMLMIRIGISKATQWTCGIEEMRLAGSKAMNRKWADFGCHANNDQSIEPASARPLTQSSKEVH